MVNYQNYNKSITCEGIAAEEKSSAPFPSNIKQKGIKMETILEVYFNEQTGMEENFKENKEYDKDIMNNLKYIIRQLNELRAE